MNILSECRDIKCARYELWLALYSSQSPNRQVFMKFVKLSEGMERRLSGERLADDGSVGTQLLGKHEVLLEDPMRIPGSHVQLCTVHVCNSRAPVVK